MSDCSGPKCNHPDHQKVDAQFTTMPRQVTERSGKKLSRNQRKARRRKGMTGY